VSNPRDYYNVFIAHWDKGQLEHKEAFKMLLLNQSNVVLGIYNISDGSIGGTCVDVRIILQAALLANASSIVLAHNHPSGELASSYSDRSMTGQIKKAAMYLNINLYDHLIICKDKYYSFADKGVL